MPHEEETHAWMYFDHSVNLGGAGFKQFYLSIKGL